LALRMLAFDYDGTLAEGGRLSPNAEQALLEAKKRGFQLGLVTGRFIDELFTICPQLGIFDLVVAENGAIVHMPEQNAIHEIAPAPSPTFLTALDQREVPYAMGRVMVASHRPYEQPVRAAIRESGLDLSVILNKNDLMILSSGTDKASGLQWALTRLGIAAEAVAGVGDAENDLALFRAVGLRVAVANALDVLKAEADLVTRASNGSGVAEFIYNHVL
jgi:hypothetical protein